MSDAERSVVVKDSFDNEKKLSFIEYLADKSDRLLQVAYLLTVNIDSKDPIRSKIRGLSFDLRDSSYLIKDRKNTSDMKEVRQIVSAARDLEVCTRILASIGHLSESNASFLSGEYRTVIRVAEDLLSLSTFSFVGEAPFPVPGSAAFQKSSMPRTAASKKEGVSLLQQGEVSRGSEDRRAQILGRIPVGGSYSIRHIAEGVPGVSEKTIQRELLAMVSEGILVKMGERRWSTYRRV